MPDKRSIEHFIPYNLEALVTVPEDHQTEKGIIIPEGVNLEEYGALNRVVKTGDKCKFLQPGDEVILNTGKPMVLKFKEGVFALIRENQIGGVFRNPDNDQEEETQRLES